MDDLPNNAPYPPFGLDEPVPVLWWGAMPSLLSRAGQLLYGRRWIPQLSETLNIPNGEVRLWASGRREIPAALWLDLRRLLRARQRELSAVLREVREEIERDDPIIDGSRIRNRASPAGTAE